LNKIYLIKSCTSTAALWLTFEYTSIFLSFVSFVLNFESPYYYCFLTLDIQRKELKPFLSLHIHAEKILAVIDESSSDDESLSFSLLTFSHSRSVHAVILMDRAYMKRGENHCGARAQKCITSCAQHWPMKNRVQTYNLLFPSFSRYSYIYMICLLNWRWDARYDVDKLL